MATIKAGFPSIGMMASPASEAPWLNWSTRLPVESRRWNRAIGPEQDPKPRAITEESPCEDLLDWTLEHALGKHVIHNSCPRAFVPTATCEGVGGAQAADIRLLAGVEVVDRNPVDHAVEFDIVQAAELAVEANEHAVGCAQQ